MKQSAAKTLGVAALGVAFAAAGAGAASAAPAPLPDSATSLDTVSSVLSAQDLLTTLPGASESLTGAQGALTQSAATLPGTVQGAAQRTLAPGAPTEAVTGLLGGLPVGQLTQTLPTGGLPVPAGGLPVVGGLLGGAV
ncbi:ATP-binding protein [Streptomyces sp. NPDC020141]|uniref:ATP-binding protein n=1 Tax=Streptomyces sp. NPDC020141 TaxID=3365065 RepID=UPI003787DAC2